MRSHTLPTAPNRQKGRRHRTRFDDPKCLCATRHPNQKRCALRSIAHALQVVHSPSYSGLPTSALPPAHDMPDCRERVPPAILDGALSAPRNYLVKRYPCAECGKGSKNGGVPQQDPREGRGARPCRSGGWHRSGESEGGAFYSFLVVLSE